MLISERGIASIRGCIDGGYGPLVTGRPCGEVAGAVTHRIYPPGGMIVEHRRGYAHVRSYLCIGIADRLSRQSLISPLQNTLAIEAVSTCADLEGSALTAQSGTVGIFRVSSHHIGQTKNREINKANGAFILTCGRGWGWSMSKLHPSPFNGSGVPQPAPRANPAYADSGSLGTSGVITAWVLCISASNRPGYDPEGRSGD